MNLLEMLTQSVGRAALNATVQPGALEPWLAQVEETVRTSGKFAKLQVAYFTLAPPPFFWNYSCARCRAYIANAQAPEMAGTCRWVRGDISPAGWCAVWLPKEEDEKRPFAWVTTVPADAQFALRVIAANIKDGPVGREQ